MRNGIRCRGVDKPGREEFEESLSQHEQRFKKSLGKKKLRIYEDFLKTPTPGSDENRFDISLIQRWIFQKILDMGWTGERFCNFDDDLFAAERNENKPERIGKKYQWIAYNEVLARISDNFQYNVEYGEGNKKYEGPWQVRAGRDIDPSCLLKQTKGQEWGHLTKTWWVPISYENWTAEPDDVAWLKRIDNLIPIESLIELTNPQDQSKWLLLESDYSWILPVAPEDEARKYDIPRRDTWYMIRSYLVRKTDIEELYGWAKNQDFWGRWMPESHDAMDIFLGEFFWAPVFQHRYIHRNSRDGWTRGENQSIPTDVLVSSEKYLREYKTYDCSLDKTISIYLPCKQLSELMNLHWRGDEGNFYDHQGNLIAFDPSVKKDGPGALLMNRDAFTKSLDENNYDIIWTVIGTKRIIGGGYKKDSWKGRQTISGAYRIYDGKLIGNLSTKFEPGESKKR